MKEISLDKTQSRKQISILFLTLVVIMLGYGMVIPIMPFYIEWLGASGTELGLLMASYSLLQLIFSPIWGGISDRIGRKPVLMLGLVGDTIAMLLFGFSNQLWMLFVARSLTGLLSSATLPTTMAYVSDSTTEEERGSGMGNLGAAMGLGVILGPGIGGWLAGESLAIPFFFAAALSFITLILVWLLLPESLPPEKRNNEQADKKTFIDLKVFRSALISPIGILLCMMFLLSFGLTNFEAIFGLYALDKFGYGPQRVGTILMVIAVVSTVGKAALTGPAVKRFGEVAIIKTSLIASSVAFGVLLLANTYINILLATAFFIFAKTLLRPAVLSLTSKRTRMGQGTVMGLSNSFMSLGRIVGPIWAGLVYDVNINYPYLSGIVIMFLGFIASLIWVKQKTTGFASSKPVAKL